MQIFPGRLGCDDVSDIMGEYKDLKVEVGEANSVRLNGIQEKRPWEWQKPRIWAQFRSNMVEVMASAKVSNR